MDQNIIIVEQTIWTKYLAKIKEFRDLGLNLESGLRNPEFLAIKRSL
jgi:predicted transcriptional regulator